MGLRTIVLKIHEPSKTKKKIIDDAIENYNKAFRFLLERAHAELEEIQKNYIYGKKVYKSNQLSKWVSKEISDSLNVFDVQPFKDSLKMELGMTLTGYFNLKSVRPETGFPLYSGAGNRRHRPVFFCRYDTKRSYCLLYDPEKNSFYAKLYLMNSSRSKTTVATGNDKRKLVYIHKDEGFLESGRKKETYIVVPLSFGKYQEQFLQEAIKRPESLRTAKLEERNGDYYLALSIDVGETDGIATGAFLGVARGLKNDLNYSLVDSEGRLIEAGALSCRKDKQQAAPIPISELHKAANSIADMAYKYKAQVIVQNLFAKGDRINWLDEDEKEYQPAFKCGIYNDLIRLLGYKLPEKGLPPPVKVSSIDIFYRCHACGFHSRRSRLTRDIFICTGCGRAMEIEAMGSLNLARKLISYNNSKIKVKVTKTSEGVWFVNPLLDMNYFIPYTENQPERLKEKIWSIVEEIKNSIKTSDDKEIYKKMSIIKKFESKKNFMSLIEFV